MSIERIINPGTFEVTELDCQRFNEAQRALLEVVSFKFRRAAEVLAAEAAFNQSRIEDKND